MDDCERPRERMLALGGDRIADTELLAIVLGTGTRGRPAETVAASLLRAAGGLAALSRATPRELAQVAGVGQVRALRIAAAFHLGRRAVEIARPPASPDGDYLRDVWLRLRPRVAGLAQEVLWVVGFDIRGCIIDDVEVARGSLHDVAVRAREVFRPLVRMAAMAGVVAHNHPSGDPTPSPQDRELTRYLREAGQVIDLPIIEHLVLTPQEFALA